jgi:replicative DNA helicase
MNCLCRNMASRGHCVGVFELEMSRDELDDRWFSMMTGINSAKLATGHGLSADEWEKITRAAEQKHEWNMLIDDTGGLTIEQLRRRAKRMVRDGAEIIFIDQLSKIAGNRKLSSYERNTLHVEEIGWLKKELGIPIVLLCQLNRQLEMRTVKYPVLSDLKLTGQIEEEADMVFLGHREYPYTRNDADLHTAVWDLAKNRGGPTYRFEMRWEPRLTTFYEIERRV